MIGLSPASAFQDVPADTNIDATGISEGVQFSADATLTVTPDGTNLGAYTDFGLNISTYSSVANTGTLTFVGASSVPGAIHQAATRLKVLNAGATGKTVTISPSPQNTFAVTTNVGSNGTTTNGTGTLALNGGDLTGTTVNFGGDGTITLAANSDITAAITNTTTNNGTLTLANGAHSLTGNIGSTGAGLKLISIGTGTTTVTGDILATQLDFTADGILSMASGSDLTIGASHFTNTTDGQGTITFAGTSTTSGSGTIGVAGTDDLLAVNVNGALSLGNDMAAITTTVNNGGTLTIAANRLITGNLALTDAGAGLATLSLGTSTLTLAGTSIFTTTAGGGNEIIATTASSSSTFGRITATGNASIEAGTTIDVTVSGSLTPGTAMKVLDAGAAGANVAITVTDNSARYNFTGSMASGDIFITPVNSTALTTVAASSNNTNVALTLDSFYGVGDMAVVQDAIFSLASSDMDSAINQLDPIVNTGQTTASFNSVSESIGALIGHLTEIRTAPTTPALPDKSKTTPTPPNKPKDTKTGVSTGDLWKNIGLWIKGFGSHANQGTRQGIDGYKANLWGLTGGFDREIKPNTRLGLAGTYSSTDVDNKGQLGGTNVHSYQGTLYATYDDPSPWYGNAGVTFAWNKYEATRNIAFSTISRIARSDTDGQQYSAFGDLGYVIKHKEFEITPQASLTYSRLHLDKYTETEAGDLNLTVNSQNYDLLQSGLGIQIARPYHLKSGTWTPEIHAKWLYDFIGDPVQTNATFTGGGSSFTTNGADPAQHSLNLGAGITYYSKGNLTLSATYDMELKEDYTSHTGQGILRYNY